MNEPGGVGGRGGERWGGGWRGPVYDPAPAKKKKSPRSQKKKKKTPQKEKERKKKKSGLISDLMCVFFL